MKKTKENISNALLAEHKSETRDLAKKAEQIILNHDAEEDYDEVRGLLKDLIKKSNVALDDLLNLASEAEHPRAYEVLSGLIKTTAEVGDQLIGLQKTRHTLNDLNQGDKPAESNFTGAATNNFFIGSTEELQRLIKGKKDEVIDVGSD